MDKLVFSKRNDRLMTITPGSINDQTISPSGSKINVVYKSRIISARPYPAIDFQRYKRQPLKVN